MIKLFKYIFARNKHRYVSAELKIFLTAFDKARKTPIPKVR